MKFVRGFKAYTERLVQEVRDELALGELDLIDMDALAKHMDIPCWPLSVFCDAAKKPRSGAAVPEIYSSVSAFTFFDGRRRRIVYNDEHGPARHRSNMAHELAHALLQHPPRDSGVGAHAEEANEAEAAWTSGVMMLPAHHARHIAVSRTPLAVAEKRFRLSPEMLRFRLNVTGANRRAA